MLKRSALLGSATMMLALAGSQPAWAQGQAGEEVVVTANKIQQRVNDVGMSIQAASGAELNKLGVTDTTQLSKVVPGFTFRPSTNGTPIFTVRGVGFQDTSLAASPTVSIYLDEVPIPFSILSTGATIDLQRVEVLKGPQGTLFGSNATGGAVNYIAAKPTAEESAGIEATYSRFNTMDIQGYVSGPLGDGLSYRLAARSIQSGPWQYNYTRPDEYGAQNLIQARGILEWEASEDFTAMLTLSGFKDQGENQMPQLYGVASLSPTSPVDPRVRFYERAPDDPRAADWSTCANISPFNEPFNTTPIGAVRPTTADNCANQEKDNTYFSANLRLDWDIGGDMTITSLSSYQTFNRWQLIEQDGTPYQVYENLQQGDVDVWYQELRLSGDFGGEGNWVFGGNYEYDKTWDRFLQTYGGSTSSPFRFFGASLCAQPRWAAECASIDLTGVPTFYTVLLGPTMPQNQMTTKTWAVFASGEYPIMDELSLQLGIRYTKMTKDFFGCGTDGGDGTWSQSSKLIQDYLELLAGTITLAQYLKPGDTTGGLGIDVGPGVCATTGPGPLFHPGQLSADFEEDNVSWRVGLNWKPDDDTLIYANVSKGYKAGSFPTVATSSYVQLIPATQEALLAYEIGAKVSLFDDTLQLNGAVFYYDYEDKQLLGSITDLAFGTLGKLVNVPNSHVIGFELSGVWEPVEGLRIAPAVSYSESEVDECEEDTPGITAPATNTCFNGHYYNLDPFSALIDLTGQPFSAAPFWAANVDLQYEWMLDGELSAFVGANVNYLDDTPGAFRNPNPPAGAQPTDILEITQRTLLDLRAGVENDNWRVQVWGRNVTNEYYWTSANRVNDVLVRWAGAPATYGITVGYKF